MHKVWSHVISSIFDRLGIFNRLGIFDRLDIFGDLGILDDLEIFDDLDIRSENYLTKLRKETLYLLLQILNINHPVIIYS